MAAVIRRKVKRCVIKQCFNPGTHQLFDSQDRLWGDCCEEHAREGAKYIDWWEMMAGLETTSLWELVPPLPEEVKALMA